MGGPPEGRSSGVVELCDRRASGRKRQTLSERAVSMGPGLWCRHELVVTVDGPQGRLVTTTNKPYARIGSHPLSDVALADPGVARRSLYLHATDRGVFCVRLTDQGGANEADRGWLGPHQEVRVGAYRVSARLADGSQPAWAAEPDLEARGSVEIPQPMLVVKYRGQPIATRRLKRRLTVVGRWRPSTLPIQSDDISAPHLVLYWEGGVLWVIDLLSRNGTLVGGRPIEADQLPLGGSLILGRVELEYASQYRPGPEAVRAAAVASGPVCPAEGAEPLQPAPPGDPQPSQFPRPALAQCPWWPREEDQLGLSLAEQSKPEGLPAGGKLLPCSAFALAWAHLLGEKAEHERQWTELVAQRQALEVRFQEQLAAIARLLVDLEGRQRALQLQLEQWFAEQKLREVSGPPASGAIGYERATPEAEPAPSGQDHGQDASTGPVEQKRPPQPELSASLAAHFPPAQPEPNAPERPRPAFQEGTGESIPPDGQEKEENIIGRFSGADALKAAEELKAAYDQLLDRLCTLSRERSSWWNRVKSALARRFGGSPAESTAEGSQPEEDPS
ncbi:MAG: FHA domain-containing protein [Thermoguttaceae bacterium]